ncbi:hypothetical protein [Rhodococcus pyridinivorans]|uniref:hypothetical protein n=1 Tax=Rhodococcus pyridinivorans TaxID=103816 RepID=UPI002657F390|nr:hypothetical protein [Rhodococcus pyridinivorans]
MAVFHVASDQAQEKGTHYIEEAVRVYLMRDLDGKDKWVIDPASFGEPLHSDYDEPLATECLCDRADDCTATVSRMKDVSLPDGSELMYMLAEALGYTVTKAAR